MFDDDLIFAEIGEEKCWLTLLKAEQTKQVVDVRKDKYFQDIDVDFLQVTTGGRIYKVEVKTDRKAHETGNIVYETKSKATEGCLKRSKADYIYYYVEATKEAYIVNLRLLNGYIEQECFREVRMGDGARGYVLPIDELEENGILTRRSG